MKTLNDIIKVRQDPTTKKYILTFSASSYTSSGCQQFWFLDSVRRLTYPGKSHILNYGAAYHEALAKWYSGEPAETCLQTAMESYGVEVPSTDYRTQGHLCTALLQRFTQAYPRETDNIKAGLDKEGKALVERKFYLPQYSDSEMEVLLDGVIDLKGKYCGQPAVVDFKTTASWDQEGYLAQAQVSPQLMLYKHAYETMFPGEEVGVMLDVVFLSKTGKNVFKRSELFHPPAMQMERFLQHLRNRIDELIGKFKAFLKWQTPNYFDYNYGQCHNPAFGTCKFLPICRNDSYDDQELVIEGDFVIKELRD